MNVTFVHDQEVIELVPSKDLEGNAKYRYKLLYISFKEDERILNWLITL